VTSMKKSGQEVERRSPPRWFWQALPVVVIVGLAVGYFGSAYLGSAQQSSSEPKKPVETTSGIGPSSTDTLPTTERQEPVLVPPFQLEGTRDASFADCVRIVADVLLQETGRLTDEQLVEIARQAVGSITELQSVNAIGVLFWYSKDAIGQEAAVASVDWAPYGQWGKANTVPTGSYSNHSYQVAYNTTQR